MEAVRRWVVSSLLLVPMLLLTQSRPAAAQNARTTNFLVHAPTQELAETVARQAEQFRDDLADYWLGRRLPAWPTPCPIEVVVGPHLAAQGATTYTRSPVGNFQMRVIGSRERILDSVLPHEVTHTVMATHFGRPLPRWADEGICTTVEHSAERNKHEIKLREYLSTRRGIPMNNLFQLAEYPSDILPMYAQGYSVCRFLIEQSGPRRFITFLEDFMESNSWTTNVRRHYGYESLRQLQDRWLAWVAGGSGSVESFVSAPATDNGTLALTAPQSASPASTAVRPASATELSDSWYQRRRNQTALGQIAASSRISTESQTGSGAVERLAPPSVIDSGRYSVSQPQAEQQFGAAHPMASSIHSAGRYR